ncbi:hypothetical protein [Rummeliibacillus sp. SL167]|uniref:hypothetical protein n=1 Tax=Rummeliibacillus sp. SL167 TaxID=2579792 RepID=UPI0011B73DBB|nr:hypothetical protein [Rummeliibacillus sp. SL167]
MTIKKLQFKPLEQYQKQNEEYSIKVDEQQAKLDEAKDAYQKATQAYEKAFTESIRTGKDATAELAKLDTEVDEAKAAYEKAARDTSLALSAISKPDFDTVALVDEWNQSFTNEIAEQQVKPIEERLELARDLIYSALLDYREVKSLYNSEIEELEGISRQNKLLGKTSSLYMIHNPISKFKVYGKPGVNTAKGYMNVLAEDYNALIGGDGSGLKKENINYIASIKDIKGAK